MSARVVVVFASRHGGTERFAMTAAVGAVEERAEIRLRRLPDSDVPLPPESTWLAKEYVPPRDADVAWADVLIFVAPAWLDPASPDLESYFSSLTALQGSGRWRLQRCAVMALAPLQAALEAKFSQLGLAIVAPPDVPDPLERARLLGRAVAAAPGT